MSLEKLQTMVVQTFWGVIEVYLGGGGGVIEVYLGGGG